MLDLLGTLNELVSALLPLNELVVLAVVIVAIALIWTYRDRVMLALTGDTQVHGTILDCVWFSCFRCCGTCTGDWTRCFTMCICCPKRCRGRNLVKAMAQLVGITSHTVELKNIVIGDLPFEGRGDFYLSVVCASNPPMVTALQEDKAPKVVHFPEIITLRLRNSPLEEQVTIEVKELNVFGSETLCKIHLNAMFVLHSGSSWAGSQQERTRRFEMKTLNMALENETPPWILIEFDEPSEVRDLDNLRATDAVRTATKDGQYHEFQMTQYKNSYALLDPNGQAVEEPLEEDLHVIHFYRTCAMYFFHMWNSLVFLVIGSYVVFRLYVWECYRRFSWLTMAYMLRESDLLDAQLEEKITFPLSFEKMRAVGTSCEAQVSGTGIKEGKTPCRPSPAQINQICTPGTAESTKLFSDSDKVQGGWGQPWPQALKGVLDGYIPDVKVGGIPCTIPQICRRADWLTEHDDHIWGLIILLLFCSCGIRCCCNSLIQRKKARLQAGRQKERRDFLATNSKAASSTGFFGG
ncbi:unnamed protein product [Polarella glacialis]|uniref:Uncharacterized protein n=1 Tax=Polarella glacialis TaxID=89957 RepID=A0A813FP63_POLGL|nr:unnamed protein product [Polarella glacialis]|mmetsp:Transcript_7348/g.13806  ORF Transcript_7348/g.13806 Transcript_7348/m.13806 type:complete len:522 (+) Transcript_7348:82-1647(+)